MNVLERLCDEIAESGKMAACLTKEQRLQIKKNVPKELIKDNYEFQSGAIKQYVKFLR